ncbi:hypothetical protein LPJ38_34810 [Bradyrhizobium daqingense]|uniref:hypothetical protein n=1 Tax=Bradyrhizobium daqingense TaxID=993502 RepID=UPI001E382355|nr:hypothetical protein [Bradyrhizobium daqingense]UFS93035.1 hypothetical protein LPJ38_34810 [Bradyrhizobium daqingense]
MASDRPRSTGRDDWVDRPAEVAPGAVKNRFPKLGLALVWIWSPVSADGAKGGTAEATVGSVAGAGALRDAVVRPAASLRVVRRVGLRCRLSTVTCGISISDGALACAGDDGCAEVAVDGDPDALGAGAGAAAGRAFDASGVACGWDWAAGGLDGLSVEGGAACWAAAIPCKQIKATDVVPERARRATQTRIPNLQRVLNA